MSDKNRFLFSLFALALLSVLFAAASAEGTFTYSLSGTGESRVASVTGYTGAYPAELVIPDTLGGYPVVSIANSAFNGKITTPCKVVLPDTVKIIYGGAFNACTGLEYIDLGESLETIQYSAFYGSGIKEITLPSTVKTIGGQAFYNCDILSSFVTNEQLESIGKEAFKTCDALVSFRMLCAQDAESARRS